MLQIMVPKTEGFDEVTEEFIDIPACNLHLEHSLLSISKWESKWNVPFIEPDSKDKKSKKTIEQMRDYVRCMTLNKNVPESAYRALTDDNWKEINAYIEAPMTATTIREFPGMQKNNEIITSELIYFWMISFNIPFECEKWHINRLITLIRVCNAKNNPKKMSKQEVLAHNRNLNEARKKALGTKG